MSGAQNLQVEKQQAEAQAETAKETIGELIADLQKLPPETKVHYIIMRDNGSVLPSAILFRMTAPVAYMVIETFKNMFGNRKMRRHG